MTSIESLSISEFTIRLLYALILGSAIGVERQWRRKSAGLRTNTLVSLGAAAYILLSIGIFKNGGGDPSRIAAQVVTGIGFLGAGVIMKEGFHIQGLNTAATIWCSAAVGLLAGIGMYKEAAITTAAIVGSHLILRPLSDKLSKIHSYRKSKTEEAFYELNIICKKSDESNIRKFIINELEHSDKHLLLSVSRSDAESNENIFLIFRLSTVGKKEAMIETILSNLTAKTKVIKASWNYLNDSDE